MSMRGREEEKQHDVGEEQKAGSMTRSNYARRKRRAAEARNAQEEKRYQRNNKALILMAAAIVAITLITRWGRDRSIVYATAPISYEDAVDGTRNYRDVLRLFANAGFTNLAEGALNDLKDKGDAQSGMVCDVSVGGNRKFSTKTRFNSTAQVIVYYHSPEKTEKDGTDVNPSAAVQTQ